jgi:AbrB family looped-hinge helix DNA binding protein
METTAIDRFGRIVIPKAIRDILGIDPLTELTISVDGETIVLSPIADPERLVVRDGVTIFDGEILDNFAGVVEQVMTKRDRLVAGGAA